MKKVWIGLGSALTITVIGSLIYFSLPVSAPANTSYAYEYYYTEEDASNPEDIPPGRSPSVATPSSKEDVPPVDTDPASITVLVNHLYTLPADYVPEDLVAPEVEFSFPYMADKRLMRSDAAAALEDLFAAAAKEGIRLTAISGYRSYDRQKTIYLYNVNRSGEEYANLYSAPPGHSEHQTGLTMDVSSVSNNLDLTYSLADLPEGQWLAEHSHLFGFIIRYPEDKESITGYAYEPWHLRYVGTELAAYLYEQNLTLDEYYGISAEDYEWDFDVESVRRNPGNTLPDDVLSYTWQSPSSDTSDTTSSTSTAGSGQTTGAGNSEAGGDASEETKPDGEEPADTEPGETSGGADSEENDNTSEGTDSEGQKPDNTDQEENGDKQPGSDDASGEDTPDEDSSEEDNPDGQKPEDSDATEQPDHTAGNENTDNSSGNSEGSDTNPEPGNESGSDSGSGSQNPSDGSQSESSDTNSGDAANGTAVDAAASDQNQEQTPPPASIGEPVSSDMPEASSSGSVD